MSGLTKTEQNSVYYLGCLVGCLLGGWIAEKIGRIKVMALGSVWGVVGASLQCSAMNPNWMICGKAARLCPQNTKAYANSTFGQRRWHWDAQRHCSSLGESMILELPARNGAFPTHVNFTVAHVF